MAAVVPAKAIVLVAEALATQVTPEVRVHAIAVARTLASRRLSAVTQVAVTTKRVSVVGQGPAPSVRPPALSLGFIVLAEIVQHCQVDRLAEVEVNARVSAVVT